MRVRGLLVVVALGLSAAAAPPAGAQDATPVLARAGGVELTASDEFDGLCLSIHGTRSDLSAAGCGDASTGVATPASGPDANGVAYVGVAAPAAAASVEIRRIGRVVGGGATVAGEPYKGEAAGLVRLAVVALAAKTPASGLRVHAKDAAGAVVAVFDSGGDRLVERRRLLSGRAARVTWALYEERGSIFDPTLLDPAREAVARCVRVEVRTTTRGESDGGNWTRQCATGTLADDLVLDTDFLHARELDRCAPRFRLLHGNVPGSVRRVTVLLGDGRRRVAPTAAQRDGTRRVWALAIAARDAVRSVTFDGAARRVVEQRLAPLAVGCSASLEYSSGWTSVSFGFDGVDLPVVALESPVTRLAGPPAARIADGPRDTLCLALGDAPFTAPGCQTVAPTFARLHAVYDDPDVARAIVFALPARVAVVRFVSKSGKATLSFPTVSADGYAGRYAGLVRFATASIARYYDFPRLELLDGAGRVLHHEEETRARPEDRAVQRFPARRIAGSAGAPSLWQRPSRIGKSLQRCLTLTAGARPHPHDPCGADRENTTILLSAPCDTRRVTVAVAVGTGMRVFAEVGAAAPRRVRLRNGAGLLTLRPGSGLRALRFVRDGRTRRIALNAPPGARQCGWRASPAIRQR